MLKIPDSVIDYMTKDGIQSAVDHLLASRQSDFPHEIVSWREAKNYHRAVLAAYQVRQEHIMFLFDLWDAIWERALIEAGSTLEVVSFVRQLEDCSAPSPATFWTEYEGHLRQLKNRSGDAPIAEVGVSYWPEGVALYVLRYGEIHEVDNLPSPWSPEADEDGYYSMELENTAPKEPSLGPIQLELINAAVAAIRWLEA